MRQGKQNKTKERKPLGQEDEKSIMQYDRKLYAFFVRSGMAPICVQMAEAMALRAEIWEAMSSQER
jgi:hypothetical protein